MAEKRAWRDKNRESRLIHTARTSIIDLCLDSVEEDSNKKYGCIYPTASGAAAILKIPREFQGHPGLVHGGITALLLDEVMGYAAAWTLGGHAFTQRLKVTYISPVLTGEKYRLDASVSSSDKGKAVVSATIFSMDIGYVVADASALFHCMPSSEK